MVSAMPSDLCCFFFFVFELLYIIASAVIVIAWLTLKDEKIDDLPILATCWSGTSAMLSSEVNGPVAHGSTR